MAKRGMKVKNSHVKHYWIMLIPAFIWLVLFQIRPMFGIIMAFQDYEPLKGLLHSEFIGLDNFTYLFELSEVRSVLTNTLIIAFGKIVGNLLVPLIFALLLNELRVKYLVKPIQTICYLPYFLSWVIIGGMMLQIFSYDGPVNQILGFLGLEPMMFFQNAGLFRKFIIVSDVWKSFGYNAVIYLAALTGIDPTLYEAATIDGAGRWKRMLYVTLPGIGSTIAMLGILSLGGILNAGFDQIYNLYNPLVYSTADIIDTYTYRIGFQQLNFSMGTTIGLLKSVVSFILITVGYWLAKKFVGYRVF